MNQEDIQKVLESISKSGITVKGDLVLEKKVNYEVANVENGGIGIQINNAKDASMTATEKNIKAELEAMLQEMDDRANPCLLSRTSGGQCIGCFLRS